MPNPSTSPSPVAQAGLTEVDAIQSVLDVIKLPRSRLKRSSSGIVAPLTDLSSPSAVDSALSEELKLSCMEDVDSLEDHFATFKQLSSSFQAHLY